MKGYQPYLMLLLLIFTRTALLGQDGFNDVLENYRKEHRLEGNYPYVYTLQTKGGVMIRYSLYFQSDSQFILATFVPDSNLIRERKYKNDILFTIVKDNVKSLLKGSQSSKLTADLQHKFKDSSYVLTQIGIRYGDLHFNHFENRLNEDCMAVSNKKIQEACTTIRQIAGVLKERI
jgi:hypothetical protein